MRAQGTKFSSQNTHKASGSLLPSPSFCPPSPQAHSPTSFTPGCQGGVRKRVCLSFSPLSTGSPLKTQQHATIIILSLLLLPKASLAVNFYLFSSKVARFPRSDGTDEVSSERGREKQQLGKEGGKELERSRFPLDDSLSPCNCLNEIRKCVSSEVNLPLTAPTQHTSQGLHLNKKIKK